MARLGEILVQQRACGAERIRQALDDQVLLGGRLGTNLLDAGAVGEEALAAALARQHGTRALHGALRPQREALALLRPELVDRLEVVPFALAGRRLSVLCCDPREVRKLDEVAFATGKVVEPIVVAEARLWAVLRDSYGLARHLRGVEEGAPRAAPAPAPAPPRAAGPDLMDEEEFQRLYSGLMVGEANANPNPNANAKENPISTATSNATSRIVRPTPPPLPPRGLPPPVNGGRAGERAGERGSTAPAGTAAPPPPSPAEPLSFAAAMAALAGVGDRDAIARIVLRHARSRFRRSVLLTVHGRSADGWEGLGEGLTPRVVAGIHASLEGEGILRTVVESRSHFLGPLARTEGNVRLLRALGGGAPRNAFAMPILARGRVVNVLYADEGRGGTVDPAGVGELLILATRISQSYDALLARPR